MLPLSPLRFSTLGKPTLGTFEIFKHFQILIVESVQGCTCVAPEREGVVTHKRCGVPKQDIESLAVLRAQ